MHPPSAALTDILRSFNRKERFYLIGTALGSPAFRLSKQFHPDTLFGKRLGSYKQKMEAVFKRLTDAYDVLGKKKRRAKYDEYLEAKDPFIGETIRLALEEGYEKALA